jgi:hypothetical protein
MVGPVGSATQRERARRQSKQNDARILVDVIGADAYVPTTVRRLPLAAKMTAMGTRAAPVRVLHDAAMHTQRFV